MAAPVAVSRRRTHALAVVPGMADAALVALCARLQAAFVEAQALHAFADAQAPDADTFAINTAMIKHGDRQDALLAEVAETPARTRAGRHAKAALALAALQPDNMDWMSGKLIMDFLEGLVRDMLAEAAP